MLLAGFAHGQVTTADFTLTVLNEQSKPAATATVELLKADKLVKAAITDARGAARFEKISPGAYVFKVSFSSYQTHTSATYSFPSDVNTATVTLKPAATTLKEVSVAARKPFIEQKPGKVVLNVDASVTNVGSTVLEVLEKSPGVTVDRNGGRDALRGDLFSQLCVRRSDQPRTRRGRSIGAGRLAAQAPGSRHSIRLGRRIAAPGTTAPPSSSSSRPSAS